MNSYEYDCLKRELDYIRQQLEMIKANQHGLTKVLPTPTYQQRLIGAINSLIYLVKTGSFIDPEYEKQIKSWIKKLEAGER
jgi:hypothetical protein